MAAIDNVDARDDVTLARAYCEDLAGIDPCAGLDAADTLVSDAATRKALELAKEAFDRIIDRATKGKQAVCDALAKLPQDASPIENPDGPFPLPDPDLPPPEPAPEPA